VAEEEALPMVMGLFAVLLASELITKVPALMKSDPFVHDDELLPFKVKVPAPTLLRSLPAVVLFTLPLRTRSPFPPRLDDEPNDIFPSQVDTVPDPLMSEPPLEIPVPFNVRDSVAELVSEKPFMSRTAPDEIVVPSLLAPSGPEAEMEEDAPRINLAFVFTVVVPV
jgi:hypothetical protein